MQKKEEANLGVKKNAKMDTKVDVNMGETLDERMYAI